MRFPRTSVLQGREDVSILDAEAHTHTHGISVRMPAKEPESG